MTLTTAGVAGIIVQFVLPLLVGLVTKSSTSAALKNALLLFLTAATTAGTAIAGGETNYAAIAATAALGYATSLAAHYGLYKPTGVTDKAQNVLVKDTVAAEEEAFDPGIPEELLDVEAK